uniref:Uncharacterized protein n=1 Tax=Ascaris lumbricoides TaxID=6252 RepID=A0A0M3HQN5_ASCLU
MSCKPAAIFVRLASHYDCSFPLCVSNHKRPAVMCREKAQSGTCGFDEGDEKSSREKHSPLGEAIRLEKKTGGRSKRKKRRMEGEVNAATA